MFLVLITCAIHFVSCYVSNSLAVNSERFRYNTLDHGSAICCFFIQHEWPAARRLDSISGVIIRRVMMRSGFTEPKYRATNGSLGMEGSGGRHPTCTNNPVTSSIERADHMGDIMQVGLGNR
ncbi:hypothetical protein ACJX0J_017799 [Zea mays]